MADVESIPTTIGRYRVQRRLGAGGMGIVYAAHDPELDRPIAVKLIRADRVSGSLAEASEQLRREAQVTAKLAHPNVVTIYDVGAHDDSVYVAMELVDGPSLDAWLDAQARTWREVMAMFFQAGMGLAVAHEAGLLHRDFKPGNVLVGGNRARVVDFGLARAMGGVASIGERLIVPPEIADDDVTSVGDESKQTMTDSVETRVVSFEDSLTQPPITDVTGSTPSVTSVNLEATDGGTAEGITALSQTSVGVFAGTPAYMAPEQFTGGGVDARTDQFSFAVSLYEGLYGERPFAGRTTSELASNVLQGRVKGEPDRTRVPGWLRSIVLKGLAVQPKERHASIKAMLASIAFTSRIMWD